MLIIGIAGGTGSGKTTVVRKIMEHLPAGEVGVISQDNYYKDSSHVPMEERQKINFDEPAAFDWDLLLAHLNDLKAGKAIDMPTYDYITSSRQKETIHMGPHDVVVLEGILGDVGRAPSRPDGHQSVCRCRCRRPPYSRYQPRLHRAWPHRTDGYRPL